MAEYSPEALAQRLELSTLHFKLRTQAYDGFSTHLPHLPGLIADNLPDCVVPVSGGPFAKAGGAPLKPWDANS